MNIYLYGSKKFKIQMKDMLNSANLIDICNEISDVKELENIITNYPKDIYLIDNDKIVSKNIITNKLKFLQSNDSISKEFLIDIGIDDMCFNTNESLLNYIINKIDNEVEVIESIQDIDEDEKRIEINKEKNMNNITVIDDINENDLKDALDFNEVINVDENEVINKDISEDLTDITNNNKVELNSSNVDEVMELIKQLLNNKTLELSIKLKEN